MATQGDGDGDGTSTHVSKTVNSSQFIPLLQSKTGALRLLSALLVPEHSTFIEQSVQKVWVLVCQYWIVYLVTQLATAIVITIYIMTVGEEGVDSYKSHFTLHFATTPHIHHKCVSSFGI